MEMQLTFAARMKILWTVCLTSCMGWTGLETFGTPLYEMDWVALVLVALCISQAVLPYHPEHRGAQVPCHPLFCHEHSGGMQGVMAKVKICMYYIYVYITTLSQ